MVDLEKFTSSYAKRLADAGEPDISVQVSVQFERHEVMQACMYLILHTQILECYLFSWKLF